MQLEFVVWSVRRRRGAGAKKQQNGREKIVTKNELRPPDFWSCCGNRDQRSVVAVGTFNDSSGALLFPTTTPPPLYRHPRANKLKITILFMIWHHLESPAQLNKSNALRYMLFKSSVLANCRTAETDSRH